MTRRFPFFIALYIVTILAHLILGLPILKMKFWLIAYIVLAVGFVLTALWWIYLPVFLWPVYILLPLAGTIALGFVRFANIKMAGPPELDPIERMETAPPNPYFIHLSDPHFIGVEKGKTIEGKRRDATTSRRVASQVIRLHPHYLLITGDVTDSGSESEWKQAEEILLNPVRQAGVSVIMAPGNHDLQPAFGVGREPGSPDRVTAIHMRRFVDEEVALGTELSTVDRRTLASLESWRPTDQEVAAKASQVYLHCLANAPIGERGAARLGAAMSWAKGCELASKPDVVRDSMVTFYTERACGDWFPLIQHDAETRTSLVVLCSSAKATSSIAANALGSLGEDQLKRLEVAFTQIPSQTSTVFVMLHHPPVRRWGDNYGVPARWWRLSEWTESALYNYALLGPEWRESVDLIDKLVGVASSPRQMTWVLLYGHRHQRSLSAISTGAWALHLSEAPALGEGDLGVRAGYLRSDPTRIDWKWLQF